ncbi:MAG: hypothetical protein FH749_07840 [Firmicutes bacterium]|nr:hypothetical protein [Bacillota bacterium]
MAWYTGVTGKVAIKEGTGDIEDIASMSTWSVELTKTMVEARHFGQTSAENKPGLKSWSASADGSADFADDSGQKKLLDAYNNGTPVEAYFYITSELFLSGTAYIESLSISDDADGKADISISLTGTGDAELTLPVEV